MQHLEPLFAHYDANGSHDGLLREATHRVSEWRDATGEMYHLQPYFLLRSGYQQAQWCKRHKPRRLVRHGVDQAGRIIVMREATSCGSQTSDTFIEYTDNTITMVRYGHDDHPLIAVSQLQQCDGVSARYYLLGVAGHKIEEIHYSDGHAIASEVWASDTLRNVPVGRQYIYEHDDEGRIMEITSVGINPDTEQATNSRSICYQRMPADQSIEQLEQRVITILTQQVSLMLREIPRDSAICCVQLVYDPENDLLPPELAIGFVEDRNQRLRQYGTAAKAEIWNPAMFRLSPVEKLRWTDPDLLDACRILNQEFQESRGKGRVIHLLNEVARQMMGDHVHLDAKLSDDFVIVAVDLEAQDHFAANLRISVPSRIRRVLKDRDLI